MLDNVLSSAVPLGLGMALAQNTMAFDRFSAMTDAERLELIRRTHGISSSSEMRIFVQQIAEGKI